MTIFHNQIAEADILEEEDEDDDNYGPATGGCRLPPPEWYVSTIPVVYSFLYLSLLELFKLQVS